MLMRPPYGDHAARPVSSYRMNRTFGAPVGAFFGVKGPQSATESRTSSLIVPLKSLYGPTACDCWAVANEESSAPNASPATVKILAGFIIAVPVRGWRYK